MKRLFKWLLGIEDEMVPVLLERGEFFKLLTMEEQATLKRRWALTLAGRSQDPCVRAIMEMIEIRISQASVLVQRRENHKGENSNQVSYSAGEAAGLNDLLLEVVRAVHAKQ